MNEEKKAVTIDTLEFRAMLPPGSILGQTYSNIVRYADAHAAAVAAKAVTDAVADAIKRATTAEARLAEVIAAASSSVDSLTRERQKLVAQLLDPQQHAQAAQYKEDPLDIVRTLLIAVDGYHNRLTAFEPSPIANNSPVIMAARRCCVERGYDKGGKAIDGVAYPVAQEHAQAALSDEQIEDIAKQSGGRWDDNHWIFEDTDFYPFARTILASQQPAAAPAAPLEKVHGDILPPVGSRVFILHGRDDEAHACTVTGYYAWKDLGGNRALSRVFVRMVYEGTTTENSRLVCECFATAEDALACRSAAPADSRANGDGSVVCPNRKGEGMVATELNEHQACGECQDITDDSAAAPAVQVQDSFEAWARSSGEFVTLKGAEQDGKPWRYFDDEAQDAWIVWQAAFAALTKGQK